MSTITTVFQLGSIHASMVALTVLLARLCFRRRAPDARALVGAIGMACILAVTGAAALPLPGIRVASRTESAVETRSGGTDAFSKASGARLPTPNRSSAGAGPFADPVVPLPLAWLARVGHGMQQMTAAAEESSRNWKRLIVVICILGTGIGLGRLAFSFRAVAQLRRSSEPVADESIRQLLAGLCERAGYQRMIEVRQTKHLPSAATCGCRKPAILLPRDWTSWSEEEVTAVLAHEVAHILRGDYALRAVALFAVAVHFYHPLVRLGAWRLAMDQEFAADRLARRIAGSAAAYGKGLARLALRYHDSFQGRRAWPSVSVMPHSKDFLARRLEMLRVKNDSADPPSARWTSYALCGAIIAIAFVAAFIRGAAADDAGPNSTPPRPIETARLPDDKRTDGAQANAVVVDPELFSRAAFDPAMLRANKGGGFVIRVADLLRHPEIQPHVDSMNTALAELLHDIIGEAADDVDLREIEWIGGDLRLSVTPTDGKGEHGRIMLGTGGLVIRTTQPRDWQASMLKEMPGTSLKTFEGKTYVQLPPIPAVGPVAMKMRSPNDRTIIYALCTKEDGGDEGVETKFLRRFFDDAPHACPWADAWRAVDGGLVTVAIDNRLTGWQQVPGKDKEFPEFAVPLFDKSGFIAFGCDWTDNSNRTGMRLRVTCDDRQSVQDIHLAAMTMLSYWPALFLEGGDATAKYHTRILQFFSSVRVLPSAADASEHFVQMSADVGWEKQELAEALRQMWGWMIDLPPARESSD